MVCKAKQLIFSIISGLISVLPLQEVNASVTAAVQVATVQAILLTESEVQGIDPSLAFAVAHVESSFSNQARSSAGAIGIMQIMPATAWGEFGIYEDELWNPAINIRVGLRFLKLLLNNYRGNVSYALSYYNGGSATGVWPNAKVLPYTASYVEKVLYLQLAYQVALRNMGIVQ